MTERVKKQLEYLRSKAYKGEREQNVAVDLTEQDKNKDAVGKKLHKFSAAVSGEKAIFHGDDIFGFNFFHTKLPENKDLPEDFNNITIDYEGVLAHGLQGIYDEIRKYYDSASEDKRKFYDDVKYCLDLSLSLIDLYSEKAGSENKTELYNALKTVPMYGAKNYYQALITLKFLQYILRLNQTAHVTIGRFDQYMKPYYELSKKQGETDEEILELTELFFISLNFDTDLYRGIQQGDNGQSIVLGGIDASGKDGFNALSEICLKASEELKLIDPKINIRVDKNTPLFLYERGTKLTKQGLGFPQYSNDDIIIPGLISLGYEPDDAKNYAVAACWEFTIPAFGADVPNIQTMNFPLAVHRATHNSLFDCPTFDDFKKAVESEIKKAVDEHIKKADEKYFAPDPLLSAFLRPCIERGKDVTEGGAKYNNYGFHGAGISNAADTLEAIYRAIYKDKTLMPQELIDALNADFVGYEDIQKMLLFYPKMGNNDDEVDKLASFMTEIFADCLKGRQNRFGGIVRAGTGSAMEYIWSGAKVPATADGRNAGKPFASSFSPSLTAKVSGPLSTIMSFTKFDLTKLVNGGPLTIEIHDTVFRNEEGEKKVAALIKAFFDLGGHQLQINAINRERLLDAQKHPDNYPNLIVRVWGWSGYFNELDKEFQNHIIKRVEFTV